MKLFMNHDCILFAFVQDKQIAPQKYILIELVVIVIRNDYTIR